MPRIHLLLAARDAQAPQANYGDAPDPRFPSLCASSELHDVDPTREWLGFSATTTTEAA